MQEERGEGPEGHSARVLHEAEPSTSKNSINLIFSCRGGGADLTKIQPAGIRTKSGGARSIEDGKGPAGSGLSLGVAGVENGGRKDATFLRPPW